jgi:hypothetical protein
MNRENTLYSFISLETFKALLSIDDREDKISRFCLVTATHTIEQYCKRRLLRKQHFEYIKFAGNLLIPLSEYPVTKVQAVFVWGNGEILEPDFYQVIPDCGTEKDIPFDILISPALNRYGWLKSLKVIYTAGYVTNEKRGEKKEKSIFVPADLQAACLELAAWNMNRYRGRRIGMTGNIRGTGKEGEHFEMSMPENVRVLLEPYVRRTI